MEKSQQNRAVYRIVALDAVIVLFLVVGVLINPRALPLLAPVCFPILLVLNFVLLRRSARKIGPPAAVEERATPHSGRFSIYACSGIFFAGTLYGLLMVIRGDLPRTVLPFLLVPLSVAIYCLRTARRAGTRGST